ncbi:MAG: hypothetical protein WA966_08075 [Ornithinimicrobium sp.]
MDRLETLSALRLRSNPLPPGGKVDARGGVVGPALDQFDGAIDDVVVDVER